MLYCKNCGLKLDGKSVLCPRCGEYTYNSINDKEFKKSSSNNSSYDDKNSYSNSMPNNLKAEENIRYDIFNPPRKHYEEYSEEKGEDHERPNKDRSPKENNGSWVKTFFKWVFIILLLVSVTTFAAYFAYNRFMGSSTKEYVKAVSDLNKKIDAANHDMAAIIKKDEANLLVDDILKQIPLEKEAFNSVIKDFDDITVPSMYSSSHNNLGKAIKLNREIYSQIDEILANPIDPKAKQNLEHLSSQVDECMSNYASVSIENVVFSLPNEILSISSKIEPWITQKQGEYGEVMDQIKAFSDYFDSMMKLFESFNTSRVDFNQTIQNVRINQASWSDLFSQIDESLSVKNKVKSDYKNLSVELRPDGCFFNALNREAG